MARATSNINQSPLSVTICPSLSPALPSSAQATITSGAFLIASLAELVSFKVSESLLLVALSRTTTNLQHWVLAQDGAQRAASRTVFRVWSSTGSVLYLRMLLLVLIASRTSIFPPYIVFLIYI